MHREISKEDAERCITHHWACDCREYQLQKMKEALEIISVVAEVWHDTENHLECPEGSNQPLLTLIQIPQDH